MGMGVGGGGDPKRPPPEMNVTPLVDVTLVVLIIFMMIAPMLSKTFWLNLPQKEEAEQEQKPPPDSDQALVMTVDKEGVIRVNRTVLKPEEVATRLPRMLAAKKQKVLYFDAHNDLAYDRVVETMDLARQGGARSIAVLTKNITK